jgi:hypothetical protein
MLLVDGATKKMVVMKHPDLSHVTRVVTNGHRLAHVGGERYIEIAQSLEMDAIAADDPGGGDLD